MCMYIICMYVMCYVYMLRVYIMSIVYIYIYIRTYYCVYEDIHTLCVIERKKVRERERGKKKLVSLAAHLAKETTETNAEKAAGTL